MTIMRLEEEKLHEAIKVLLNDWATNEYISQMINQSVEKIIKSFLN